MLLGLSFYVRSRSLACSFNVVLDSATYAETRNASSSVNADEVDEK